MKNIYILSIVMAFAHVAFGQCGTPPCNFIYVTTSGTAGNPGTANCPTTLAQALTLVNSTQNTILIQGGSYTINNTLIIPAIVGGVTIDGGYDATWIKNSTVGYTTLNINPVATNNGTVGYYIGIEPAGGANGFNLKDLTINVQSAGASGTYNNMGLSVYGIYLSGQTGYSISRCVINTGNGSGGNAGVYDGTSGGGSSGGAGAFTGYSPYNGQAVGSSCGGGNGCSRCPNCGGVAGGTGAGSFGGGAGGAGGGQCCSSGCNIFNCNANGCTGGNGSNGGTGNSATPYAGTPSGVGGLSSVFYPVSGSTGYAGDGGGGGGGGGPGEGGTCCSCGCGNGWAFGGTGGNGGDGGAGGAGGYGGGGSFAVYVWGGSGTIVDCSINSGAGGTGGGGAAGHPGAGGGGGGAGENRGGCDGGVGGTGGSGGSGGTGGAGQQGATGISAHVELLNGATMGGNYGGSNVVPADGIVTANWYSGCTNSEIDLTKSTADTWQLLNGSVFVNNLTSGSSSFTASSSPAEIYYPTGTPTGTYNLGLGLTTFTDFIKITGNRLITPVNSIINTIPNPCPSAAVTLGASLTGAQQSNIVAYDWEIMNTSAPGTAVYTSTAANTGPVTISGGWVPGATYQVRLRLKEQCCGWSIPIWGSFTTLFVPVNAGAISGTSILCPSSTQSYSISAVGNTTGYTWTVSGGTITANSSTTYSANVTSITVIWGPSGAGTVSVQPYNACGYSPSATTLNITIDGVPGITITPAPANGVICLTGSATLQANATSGSGGNGSFTYLWSTASTNQIISPAPVINTTYSVTVTEGSSNCSASASQAITVNNPPTVNVGAGQSMCSSAGVVNITGASAGSYSSLNWTTSGTGYFTSGNTVNASYTPGAADLSAGSVILTLTAYGNLPCGNATSSKTITIVPVPTADAGTDQTMCSSSGSVSITGANATNYISLNWTTSGSGTFTNGNSLTPVYTPSAADLTAGSVILSFTATGTSPCGSVASAKNLVFITAPTANAGGHQSMCTSAGAVSLTGASAGNYSSLNWTTDGTGVFTNGASLTASYTPSPADITAGFVTLTLSASGNSPCGNVTDTKILTITLAATSSTGGNQSTCSNSGLVGITSASATNYNSLLWTSSGSGSFTNGTTLTPGYTPGAADILAGSVTLTLTALGNAPCSNVSSNMLLTIVPAPVVSAGPGQSTCANSPVAITGASASAYSSLNWTTSGTGTFTNANTLNPVYTPSIADSVVTLTLTASGNTPCALTTSTKVLTILPLPNGSISGTTSICRGTSATLTFNFSIGTGPFNVSYTDGTNIYTANGVSNGSQVTVSPLATATFSFTSITDANSCNQTSGFMGGALVTVTSLPVISSISVSPALCNGSSTGIIAITAGLGTPPYTYSIDGGTTFQTSNVFGGLPQGTNYNLAVTDIQHCTSPYQFNPVTVTQPTPLLQVDSATDASCGNVFDGSIAITATGGIPSYSYSLNGGPSQPGNVFTGLASGNYVVTVQDANGCIDTAHTVIGNSYAVTGSLVNQTNVSCFGGADGTVSVQLSGGVPPYSYSINGFTFQPTSTFTGLTSGNYTVTLRDSKGCTAFVPVSISQPGLLAVAIDSLHNVLCNGQSQGGIFIHVSGGTGPYSFIWSNGATTQNVTNLSAGTFNVTVVDAKGCNSSSGATISQPLPLFLNIATYHNLSCFNDSSGYIYVNTSGGMPSYSYAWSNGASTQDITGLNQGAYSLTVNDMNGCRQTISQTLTQPLQLSSGISGTNVTCGGASNGSVTLTVNGGTPSYSFYWSNGDTTQDLSNVPGGNYSVVIHDANNCSAVNDFAVAEPQPMTIGLTVTNVNCYADSNGMVVLTVSGGTTPYSFNWSNGATTQSATNLIAGIYHVTVMDALGCTSILSATISQPQPLFLNIATYHNLSCFNDSSGYIYANATGGMPSYSYAWSSGASTQDITGLSQGAYSLTVNDMNGCQQTISQTLTQPLQLSSGISGTNVTCGGASNGSVTLTVNGGTPSYSFYWSNGDTTQDLSNVPGGNYSVVIHDADNCSAVNVFTVAQPQPIAVGVTATNVSCYAASNGTVDLTVTGGSNPISYLWSNGSTGANLTGVDSGTYTVTITDAHLCTASATANITQPGALMLNATPVNVLCVGGSNGALYVTVNGGVFPYNYNWSNGSSTQNITGLINGSYSLTVTDGNACSATASYTINGATAILDSISSANVTCFGANNGSVSLTVNGGTAPYSYLWSNFLGSQNINNVGGGLYYVLITDANGCQHRDSALVQEPAQLVITTTVRQITCFNANNGAIRLRVTGGTPAYVYAWNTGQADSSETGLPGGIYVITVTDSHICTVATTINLANPPAIGDNFVVRNPLCHGDSNGGINLIPSGGEPPFTFLWSNLDTSEHIANLTGGIYFVTITDSRGCDMIDSVNVIQPSSMYTTGVIKNISCFGNIDGAAYVTVYGGTLPYTYDWSNLASTQDIVNVPGGNYYVTITDANGCQVASLYDIQTPAKLTLNLTATNVLCYGGSTGSVTAVAGGGTIPYSYLWNNVASVATQTGISAGLYGLELVDSNGCHVYDSIVVTQPLQIQISGQVNNVACFGASTGSVNLAVTGGNPAYNYAWSNGAVTPNLNAVSANTYRVTVTDASSCAVSDSFAIQQGTEMIVALAANPPVCFDANSGFISASVYGGMPPYRYLWSNVPPDTNMLANRLTAGIYHVTITDNLGCTASSGTVLAQPLPVTVAAFASGSRCFNSASGMVIANVSGGTAPYNYLLNGASQASDTFAHLLPGNYDILVLDVNGCQGKDSFTITSHNPLSVSLSVSDPVILTGMQTRLTALATSDTAILSYIWSPLIVDSAEIFNFGNCTDTFDCSTAYVKPPFTMVFTVTAMNADSCYASDTATVFVNKEQVSFIPTVFTPNNDGLNDRFQFAILGASNIDVSIYNRWGETVFHNTNQTNSTTATDGWDGTYNGKQAPTDTYVYKMAVTYFDGTTQNKTGTITLMR